MVSGYKDLEVWQLGRELTRKMYIFTENFPKAEQYRLTDQLLRASISVPSNIAEGSSRKSTKEFIRYIRIALGSLSEIETQLYIADDIYRIKDEVLFNDIEFLGKKLGALEKSLNARLNAQKITTLNTQYSNN